jgi:hypothetical protein
MKPPLVAFFFDRNVKIAVRLFKPKGSVID